MESNEMVKWKVVEQKQNITRTNDGKRPLKKHKSRKACRQELLNSKEHFDDKVWRLRRYIRPEQVAKLRLLSTLDHSKSVRYLAT